MGSLDFHGENELYPFPNNSPILNDFKASDLRKEWLWQALRICGLYWEHIKEQNLPLALGEDMTF